MNKRLYVGNLSYQTTEKELQELFGEFGEVTFAKVINRSDGRSKGFGFVEMGEEDSAQKAMEKLNQSTFMERTLVVNEAKEQEPRPPRGGRDSRGGGYGGRGGGGGYGGRGGGSGDDLNYKLRQLRRKFK
ncbi:MAG: RNA-binding protein [Actinomycetota bacterium]|nr:MAG: RNA-binding protein [Actinomycetota bacterium]